MPVIGLKIIDCCDCTLHGCLRKMAEWKLTEGETTKLALRHLYVVLILIWRINSGSCAGITNPPEDYVAYQDHDATFTCTAINTPFLVWKVNLTDLTDYPANIQADFSIDGMQENNEETIVLMVRSHCIYNNTQIQCEARNLDGELIQTEMAILFIQGLLPAVNILRHTISDNYIISILWSPLFSLNVTGIEPDIWYTVEVIDSTDTNVLPPTPCSSPTRFNCYMLIGTNYTFYPDSPSPCNKYSFTIIPINGAGQGERSEAINITDTSDKFHFFISDVQRNLVFINDSAFSIQFVITGSQGLCAFEYVMNVTGEKEDKPYNYTSQHFYLIRNTVTFTVSTNELPYDVQYEITLAVKHANGSSLWSSQYPLSTFDVQNATVRVVDGTITISEQFAMNSSATGCFIVTSCDVGISKFMAVPINVGAGTVSGLEQGTCAVLVYDLERNGKPGIRPAVEIETIQVNGSSDEMIFESDVLENVKLSVKEVDCGFKTGGDSIGCVVICLSNDDTSLIIQNFSSKDAFPMPANLSDRLTCAVFGSIDGILEKHPSVTVELSESPSGDGKPPTEDGGVITTVIIIAAAMGGGALIVFLVVVFLAVFCPCCVKSSGGQGPHKRTYSFRPKHWADASASHSLSHNQQRKDVTASFHMPEDYTGHTSFNTSDPVRRSPSPLSYSRVHDHSHAGAEPTTSFQLTGDGTDL